MRKLVPEQSQAEAHTDAAQTSRRLFMRPQSTPAALRAFAVANHCTGMMP